MIAIFPSPLGLITLEEQNNALTHLRFTPDALPLLPATPLLKEAVIQLNAYFSGHLHAFSLPLSPEGTAFQKIVWQGLQQIPYGETLSYAGLAALIGHSKACRAVGNANGKNPLPILIPCHRVIAADGCLGGYSAGAGVKERLLALEGIALQRDEKAYNIQKSSIHNCFPFVFSEKRG